MQILAAFTAAHQIHVGEVGQWVIKAGDVGIVRGRGSQIILDQVRCHNQVGSSMSCALCDVVQVHAGMRKVGYDRGMHGCEACVPTSSM